MTPIINTLAIVGGTCVLCTLLMFAIGISDVIAEKRKEAKKKKTESEKKEEAPVLCDRCKQKADHHGFFYLDDERLCWYCFKKDEIKNDLLGGKHDE